MLKRNLSPKKAQLTTLLVLLALAVAVMVFLFKSSHRYDNGHNPFNSSFVPAGGDTLNVAIEMNPSVYKVVGDTVSGKDYDILERISKMHNIPIKYFPFVPLQKALDGLDAGVFDLVVASIPATTAIKDKYLMTEPVYLDREILVQLIDSTRTPIKSQVELGGDTVWVTSNSPFKPRLANLAAEIGDTIYIESSPDYSSEALFILTATGHIKYAVINENIAKALHPDYPNVDISTPISFTQFQSWALRKDSQPLCDSLNVWISQVKSKYPSSR